jgi:hypothetical protein
MRQHRFPVHATVYVRTQDGNVVLVRSGLSSRRGGWRRCAPGRGGRFITVLPRSRKEDATFRALMHDHQPGWAEALPAPGARLGGPTRVHAVCEAPAPSAEGYGIGVHDSGKQERDAPTRARRIEKAMAAVDDLALRPERQAHVPTGCASPRCVCHRCWTSIR